MVYIIDGKQLAKELRENITKEVTEFKQLWDFVPGLATVLVSDDPASKVYVNMKKKFAKEVGMNSFQYNYMNKIPSTTELLFDIKGILKRDDVHGVLVQLPLPDSIDETLILNEINPEKDVDGFHPINVGKLVIGQDGFVPCTPLGCIRLIKSYKEDLTGLHAVIVGRSNIVGKPIAHLLLQENCTITIAHSRTKNLKQVCRSADILIAAVGQPEFIRGNWIKKGAIIIDVGINRVKDKLVGDVHFKTVSERAGAITPVPGGVGPMTIACLLQNTLQAAKNSLHFTKYASIS